MSEPLLADDAGRPLQYAASDVTSADRLSGILAAASIALALLGFPLGAFASIFPSGHPELASRPTSERGGFMLFAVMEGLAVACGTLGMLRTRARKRLPRTGLPSRA